jgi:transcriptional regulator with XRE-family HTH domain
VKTKDEKYLKAFGKHVRKLRNDRKLSQEQLNDEAGLGKNQLGLIERGEVNPSLITMKSLAIALGLDLKTLVDF